MCDVVVAVVVAAAVAVAVAVAKIIFFLVGCVLRSLLKLLPNIGLI